MRLACPSCGAPTDFQIPTSGPSSHVLNCPGCKIRFRVGIHRPEAPAEEERYRHAKEFARRNGIDLASAYSVLEGVISLEEARGLPYGAERIHPSEDHPAGTQLHGAAPRTRSAAAPSLSGRTEDADALPYDPGFAQAIRDGYLTVRQAMERGDRAALAMRLSTRHRLPLELAYQAADHRITIRQALLQKAALESKTPLPRQVALSRGPGRPFFYGAGAVVLVGLGIFIRGLWEESASLPSAGALIRRVNAAAGSEAPAPAMPLPPPALTLPKTDAAGQLVEIVGPDPRSVLISFCSHGLQSGQRDPVEISPTVPPNAGARLGVFRNLAQPDLPLRAIRIRKDPRTSRWIAGDGRRPIPTEARLDLPDVIDVPDIGTLYDAPPTGEPPLG